MRYLVQPRNHLFVKGHEFLSFPKNIDKNFGKKISKTLNGKYSQKLFDHAKQSATDEFKTSSKKVIRKIVEATGDMIGNKIANRITKVSKSSQNNLETITNEHDEEIHIYRYISPKER